MNGVAWALKEQHRDLPGLSLGIQLSSPAPHRSAGSGQDACPCSGGQACVIAAGEPSFLGLLSPAVGGSVSEVPALGWPFLVSKRERGRYNSCSAESDGDYCRFSL